MGVGWGGACINVHVNLQMKYMLRFGCPRVHVFMGGVGWGGIITSMALSFIGHAALLFVLLSFAPLRHATVLYVFLNFAVMRHAALLYVLLIFAFMRHATLLYVRLNFALMRHAMLLYVLLNFALMRHAMLLYVLMNFALMGHATHPSVTQYVFMWCWRSSLQSPDPKRFLEELEALAALTKRRLKTCDDKLFSGWPENPKW